VPPNNGIQPTHFAPPTAQRSRTLAATRLGSADAGPLDGQVNKSEDIQGGEL